MAESIVDNSTLNFDPEEEINSQSAVVTVVFVIIAILGISGNGLVLVVVAKVPDLRSITNILIAHQSFVDFISSLLLLLTFFPTTIDLGSVGKSHPAFANFICKVWLDQFIYWGVIKVSTVNLVFLTLERYFAVVYPHNYRQRASRRRALLVCLSAWIVGPLSEMYFLFSFSVNEDGECAKNTLMRGGEYAIAFMVFLFTLVVPLAIMAFVYVSIVRALRPVKPVVNITSSTAQLNRSNISLQNGNRLVPVPAVSTTVSFRDGGPPPPRPPPPADGGNRQPPRNGNAPHAQISKPAAAASATKTVRERARRNVLTTMFLVSLTYAVCWSPNQIIYFYYNLVSQTDFTGSIYLFTIVLAGFNVCVNPIIYAFKYRKFQQGLRQLILRKPPSTWETTATDPS